jgi:hypothetical protein
MVCGCGLVRIGPVIDCYENYNEHVDSIKYGEMLSAEVLSASQTPFV